MEHLMYQLGCQTYIVPRQIRPNIPDGGQPPLKAYCGVAVEIFGTVHETSVQNGMGTVIQGKGKRMEAGPEGFEVNTFKLSVYSLI